MPLMQNNQLFPEEKMCQLLGSVLCLNNKKLGYQKLQKGMCWIGDTDGVDGLLSARSFTDANVLSNVQANFLKLL